MCCDHRILAEKLLFGNGCTIALGFGLQDFVHRVGGNYSCRG